MTRESSMELGLRNPMERSITGELLRWKKETGRKALLLRGERQIGKTLIVRRFAAENYAYFAEFNFYENPADRDIFSKASGYEQILTAITLARRNFKIERGRSLLFLDEIQECPEAVTAVKFLVEKSDVDIIMSGSHLGYSYKTPRSYPVGSVTYRDMHPMTFEEFLLSQGIGRDVPESIRQHIRDKKPFDDAVLLQIQALFREYLVVGGMPECELYYKLDRNDMGRVITAQEDIITAYKSDIMQYAPAKDRIAVSKEFQMIPVQLGRPNKKVIYSEIEDRPNSGFREYGDAIGWICESRFVNPCFRLNAIERPLEEHKDVRSVKLYANDTGLLMNMFGRDTAMAVLRDDISVNEGAIAENVVCQMLVSQGIVPYYFETNKSGEDRMEIDFIIRIESDIAAIEVKSGKKRRASSIRKLKTSRFGTNITRYIKFHNGNISEDDFEHYPIFCAGFMDAMTEDKEIRMPPRLGN